MPVQEDLRVRVEKTLSMQPVGSGPSYEQLLAENQRLKKQLAERSSAINIQLESERVSLRELSSEDLHIRELELSVPGLQKMVQPMLKAASTLSASGGKLQMPDLSHFAHYPMRVEKLDVSVQQNTLNAALRQRPVEGMSDLRLEVGGQGRVRLSGFARKLIPIPFEVEGRLSVAPGSRLAFDLEKTRVAGFIPIPNLMTNFFASLASREMAQMNVTQKGNHYEVDLRTFFPEQVEVRIDSVQTQPGQIRLQAGMNEL
jgi:hypothetical protein